MRLDGNHIGILHQFAAILPLRFFFGGSLSLTGVVTVADIHSMSSLERTMAASAAAPGRRRIYAEYRDIAS